MFGGGSQQTTGVSDLLLGAGGFGSSSLGNGFGNADAATSGAAAGGSSSGTTTSATSNTAFDLNDFPSLGGGVGSATSTGANSDATAVANNTSGSNGLAAALRQQQQLLAHQQMLQGGAQKQQQQQQQNNLYRLAMQGGSNGGNFNMAFEDFPALPGAPPPSSSGAGSGNAGVGTSTSQSLLMGGGNSAVNSSPGGFGGAPSRSMGGANASGGLYGTDLDSSGQAPGSSGANQLEGAGLLGGNGLGGLGGLAGLQQSSSANSSSQLNMQTSRGAGSGVGASSGGGGGGSGTTTGTALSGDYGLLGLLGVIRMTDADRNALALGSDLTMLGLNLGSSEHIYNTFSGPWTESSGNTKEPHYQLPMCYYMQPPALKTGHLSKFQLETLFYIFYAMPKDVLQAYAAQELYTREWRYHGDLKLWFKRAGPSDGITTSSATPQYLYFDINSWERRLFNGNMNQNVTGGFLTDEDVRVKFQTSS
mmetsp:Transcript_9786/g.15684  ORF Transcript_9786/g.15684 Transcript_9786/m.15684 type:complete len:477 (+) Transcript_9786:300-1730(+)|eukprot:CAMPEP_0178746564 /NCGR_PEP_ID=MMETSP0744-20121128/7873_1 /TAXON_ID=913974 /ORGANISM="Nitzschia punctata, Strain CCMP561" /LENGTH=476 /DNA_ID=CAMNT_0020399777 /DNA_START=198 /DNA_END=1628 /DNA_ORIENTATION=+